MAIIYYNRTRRDAVVTIRVESVVDSKKALKVGETSAMKELPAEVGVHDLVVGPDQVLELSDGVTATFLAARAST